MRLRDAFNTTTKTATKTATTTTTSVFDWSPATI